MIEEYCPRCESENLILGISKIAKTYRCINCNYTWTVNREKEETENESSDEF